MKRISNSDSIHFWMVFQIIKNELVANVCYLIRSGTWPDLWLKWICQWIPKKKMMCLCKWKGSQIQIPFILAWYFKVQKMCLLPMIVIPICSGTWPDLWMCLCKWKGSQIQIPFIFAWYFKLQKNVLVANDCYWICSGTWPDLWLKWICLIEIKRIYNLDSIHFCMVFQITKNELDCQILLLNLQWILTRSLVEVNLPMDPKDDDIMLIEIKRIYNLDSIHFCMVFQITKKWACCQILLLNLQWNSTRSLVEVNLPMDPKDDDDYADCK